MTSTAHGAADGALYPQAQARATARAEKTPSHLHGAPDGAARRDFGVPTARCAPLKGAHTPGPGTAHIYKESEHMAQGSDNAPVIPAPRGTFATVRKPDGSSGFKDVFAFSAAGDPLVGHPDTGRLIPLREYLALTDFTFNGLCGP